MATTKLLEELQATQIMEKFAVAAREGVGESGRGA